jgi:hypothetical protein
MVMPRCRSSGALSIWSKGVSRGERGLAVVDVPDGADVHMRLGPLELRLRHWGLQVT